MHLLLYFVSKKRISGAEARNLRVLHHLVNIVPIICQGDCLDPQDIPRIKESVRMSSAAQSINWYDCRKVGLTRRSRSSRSSCRSWRTRRWASARPS